MRTARFITWRSGEKPVKAGDDRYVRNIRLQSITASQTPHSRRFTLVLHVQRCYHKRINCRRRRVACFSGGTKRAHVYRLHCIQTALYGLSPFTNGAHRMLLNRQLNSCDDRTDGLKNDRTGRKPVVVLFFHPAFSIAPPPCPPIPLQYRGRNRMLKHVEYV